jgi:hypothetical protein
MKATLHTVGLFARQRTSTPIAQRLFCVAERIFIAVLIGILVASCHDKTKGQVSDTKGGDSTALSQSFIKPKTDVTVNRHYDNKGNMIGFDSTYTSFYSNVQGDTTQMDSLMSRFNRYFSNSHSHWFDSRINSVFFKDSLRYPDFFHDDFFIRRYELNDMYFKDMMRRMDSVKNRFYQEQSAKDQLSHKNK